MVRRELVIVFEGWLVGPSIMDSVPMSIVYGYWISHDSIMRTIGNNMSGKERGFGEAKEVEEDEE